MPCNDGGPSYEQVQEERAAKARRAQEIRNIEAFLCAICTVLNDTGKPPLGKVRVGKGTFDLVLDRVNWDEAGVTRDDLLTWWKKHQKADEARRVQEKKKRDAEDRKIASKLLRETALAKLTPEERDAVLSPHKPMETEERWFRVTGTSPDLKNSRAVTRDYQITVPVSGSYDLVKSAAIKEIARRHNFEVACIVSHSLKRATL